jgi:hypothetical protein
MIIPSQRLQIFDAKALSLRGCQVPLPVQLVSLSINIIFGQPVYVINNIVFTRLPERPKANPC